MHPIHTDENNGDDGNRDHDFKQCKARPEFQVPDL